MDVKVLVEKAIAGIERGKTEIRPGLANVLKTMSRVAPQFTSDQPDDVFAAYPAGLEDSVGLGNLLDWPDLLHP